MINSVSHPKSWSQSGESMGPKRRPNPLSALPTCHLFGAAQMVRGLSWAHVVRSRSVDPLARKANLSKQSRNFLVPAASVRSPTTCHESLNFRISVDVEDSSQIVGLFRETGRSAFQSSSLSPRRTSRRAESCYGTTARNISRPAPSPMKKATTRDLLGCVRRC